MDKYYVADPGLRYYLLGKKQGDKGHILENVVNSKRNKDFRKRVSSI